MLNIMTSSFALHANEKFISNPKNKIIYKVINVLSIYIH